MALLQINFFSESLKKITTFHMFLPNDMQEHMVEGNPHYQRERKALFLLHGFSGNTIDWMTGSLVQEIALKYNIAVVMPSGDNSFYLDGKGTGRAYGKFVGEELVAYIRKTFGLANKSEDTYIGGLSMGGFGAIHTGLQYSDTFGRVFGLSSALIINSIKEMKPGSRNDIADYDYYVSVFGELEKLDKSENNPEYLIKKLKKEERRLPPIFMACGTEDFLLQENREFRDYLIKEQVEVTYRESSGTHEWKFWNEYLEQAVLWTLSECIQ